VHGEVRGASAVLGVAVFVVALAVVQEGEPGEHGGVDV